MADEIESGDLILEAQPQAFHFRQAADALEALREQLHGHSCMNEAPYEAAGYIAALEKVVEAARAVVQPFDGHWGVVGVPNSKHRALRDLLTALPTKEGNDDEQPIDV